MANIDIAKIANYWSKSADEDYTTAQGLFNLHRYVHCLFFCHQTIEKILKSLAVKKIKTHAPFEHNLLQLAQLTGLDFSEDQLKDLNTINTFNIKARYDDYKFRFYKKATESYTRDYLFKTQNLYLWLQRQTIK